MKNQWLIWAFVIGVVIIVLFAFNHQGQDMVSLNDIFPEGEMLAEPEIEYEFVDQEIVRPVDELEEAPVGSVASPVKESTVAPASTVSGVKPPSDAPVKDLASIPFTIQVLSFRDMDKAQKALADVKAAGHPGFIATADLGEKGTWHRIYVGQFNSRSEAESFLSKVQNKYKDSFIISPKK